MSMEQPSKTTGTIEPTENAESISYLTAERGREITKLLEKYKKEYEVNQLKEKYYEIAMLQKLVGPERKVDYDKLKKELGINSEEEIKDFENARVGVEFINYSRTYDVDGKPVNYEGKRGHLPEENQPEM